MTKGIEYVEQGLINYQKKLQRTTVKKITKAS